MNIKYLDGVSADDEAAAAVDSASPQGLLEGHGVHSCFLWSRCGLYRQGYLVFKESCPQGSSSAQGEKSNTSGSRKELGVTAQHGEAPAVVEGTSDKSPVRSPSEEPTSVSLQENFLNFCQPQSVGSPLKIVPVQVKYFPAVFYTWHCLILSAYSPLLHAYPSQKEEETS